MSTLQFYLGIGLTENVEVTTMGPDLVLEERTNNVVEGLTRRVEMGSHTGVVSSVPQETLVFYPVQ